MQELSLRGAPVQRKLRGEPWTQRMLTVTICHRACELQPCLPRKPNAISPPGRTTRYVSLPDPLHMMPQASLDKATGQYIM